MALTAILRRSATKAAPLASRFIGNQQKHAFHSATTAFSLSTAAKRATNSPQLRRPTSLYFSTRQFSSDRPSSDTKLLEVVQSEIDVVEQSDDFGKTVEAPGDFPFSINDNVGEQSVTLTREYGDETISVEVYMPNLVTGEEDDEDPSEDEGGSESSVPLMVTVVKKNGPHLEFDCTAYPEEIKINALSLKNTETEDQLAYEGPDFFDLDENLQKAFHKYLEIRGIKPSTTNFLHEYMIEKDNREYLRWLKDVKKFVEA